MLSNQLHRRSCPPSCKEIISLSYRCVSLRLCTHSKFDRGRVTLLKRLYDASIIPVLLLDCALVLLFHLRILDLTLQTDSRWWRRWSSSTAEVSPCLSRRISTLALYTTCSFTSWFITLQASTVYSYSTSIIRIDLRLFKVHCIWLHSPLTFSYITCANYEVLSIPVIRNWRILVFVNCYCFPRKANYVRSLEEIVLAILRTEWNNQLAQLFSMESNKLVIISISIPIGL